MKIVCDCKLRMSLQNSEKASPGEAKRAKKRDQKLIFDRVKHILYGMPERYTLENVYKVKMTFIYYMYEKRRCYHLRNSVECSHRDLSIFDLHRVSIFHLCKKSSGNPNRKGGSLFV